MERVSNILRLLIVCFIFISIIFIGTPITSVNSLQEESNFHDSDVISVLISHPSILILSDDDFAPFPGTGSQINPYIIENYNITTTDYSGIYVSSTTKYFIIRNCFINAEESGIYLYSVSAGTAIITNNTCEDNTYTGISTRFSDDVIISNNTIYSSDYCIDISYSSNATIANNTFQETWSGIDLYKSNNSVIQNNQGIGYGGIYLDDCSISTVINNTLNDCANGIRCNVANSITLTYNRITNAGFESLQVMNSTNCVISHNYFLNTLGYAVALRDGTSNTSIHHNDFIDNEIIFTSQAYDEGINNTWFDSSAMKGNYWSDHAGVGGYPIDGTAGTIDLYPLVMPVIPELGQNFYLLLMICFLSITSLMTLLNRRKK